MAWEEITHSCTICGAEWNVSDGGLTADFNTKHVNFCPECVDNLTDLLRDPVDEDDLFDYIRGYQYVVINDCHGGFGLSRAGVLAYLDKAGIHYDIVDQPDRERQIKLGGKIMVNGHDFYARTIPRDDPALVNVVRELGSTANGDFAELKVVKIPPGVKWQIEEYDGTEWVAEKHRTWT